MSTRAGKFPLLDSVRAIAMLCVLTGHAAYFMSLSGTHTLLRVRWEFAVQIFFIVSGFLLYRPFIRARLDGRSPRIAGYAWRRALRIVPAYWVALTVVGLSIGLAGVFTSDGVPTYYGFAQVYRPDTAFGGLPQAWSLCVEAGFYVLLPAYAAVMSRYARPGRRLLRCELLGAGVVFLASAAYKGLLAGTGAVEDPHQVYLQLNTLAFLDAFAVGIALAALSVAVERGRDRPGWLRVLEQRPAVTWVVALAGVWVVSTQLGLTGELQDRPGPGQYLAHHYISTLIAASIALPAMFGDPGRGLVRRVLANRTLLWLGTIAYGATLFHMAVLTQLERLHFTAVAAITGTWVWIAVTLLATACLAGASYYAIERPLLRLKRLVPVVRRSAPPQDNLLRDHRDGAISVAEGQEQLVATVG